LHNGLIGREGNISHLLKKTANDMANPGGLEEVSIKPFPLARSKLFDVSANNWHEVLLLLPPNGPHLATPGEMCRAHSIDKLFGLVKESR
jgi:hypothetical protein